MRLSIRLSVFMRHFCFNSSLDTEKICAYISYITRCMQHNSLAFTQLINLMNFNGQPHITLHDEITTPEFRNHIGSIYNSNTQIINSQQLISTTRLQIPISTFLPSSESGTGSKCSVQEGSTLSISWN